MAFCNEENISVAFNEFRYPGAKMLTILMETNFASPTVAVQSTMQKLSSLLLIVVKESLKLQQKLLPANWMS